MKQMLVCGNYSRILHLLHPHNLSFVLMRYALLCGVVFVEIALLCLAHNASNVRHGTFVLAVHRQPGTNAT